MDETTRRKWEELQSRLHKLLETLSLPDDIALEADVLRVRCALDALVKNAEQARSKSSRLTRVDLRQLSDKELAEYTICGSDKITSDEDCPVQSCQDCPHLRLYDGSSILEAEEKTQAILEETFGPD